jgi:transcription termination/antitermination protein NusA
MVEIRLTDALLRNMTTFRKITGTEAKDCIMTETKAVFVVKSGDLGKAIGKNMKHLHRLKDHFKKNVDLIEFSEDPDKFVKKIFHDYTTGDVKVELKQGKKVLTLKVNRADKGLIIGKSGRNLKIAKDLMKRYSGIDDVVIQ